MPRHIISSFIHKRKIQMTKENVLQNEAKLVDSAKNKDCSYCDEVIVLECLKFAELQGAIPPLPETWWEETKTRINLP